MVDPTQHQKGSFGAFAAREQEQHDVRAAAGSQAARDVGTGPTAAAATAATPPPSPVSRAETTTTRAGADV